MFPRRAFDIPPAAASRRACSLQPRLAVASLAALALISALVGGCVRDEGQKILRLGHGLDPSHPVHQAMIYLGERLVELSRGRLSLHIYPSEQLGSERECLELLQIGSLGLTKVSASVLEGFAPDFRVLGLPYLFRDRAHRFAVLDGPTGDRLLLSAQPFRLRGLAFYDAGSRSFYTREHPVSSPEDLVGQKIRVQESATAMAMVRSLGGSPTPISWGELYTALQQGVVDGAENNPPSFHLSRHYEVSRYYSLDEHTAVPDVLLISSLVWDRLTGEEQAWLHRAARDSAAVQRRLWAEAEKKALEAVAEAGVEILRPDKEAFLERSAGLLESAAEEPRLAELIDEIRDHRGDPP